MIRAVTQPNAWQTLSATLIALLALGASFVILTQPLFISLALISTISLTVLMGITPLVAMVALLVLAPMRTLIATESDFVFPLDVGQILFIVFVLAWTIRRIADKNRLLRFVWSDLYVFVGTFIVATALTAFNAASLGAWLSEWLKWVLMLVLVLFALNLRIQRAWEWLAFGLVLAGIANALIGIYIFFGGSGALHLLVIDRFFRAFGTFGQPNPFGGFMGLLIPIALMMAYGYAWHIWQQWHNTRRSNRSAVLWMSYYGTGAALMTIALFMSWSRGAWLGFAISMFVILVALPPRLWQGVIVAGTIGILGGVLWFGGLVPATIAERVGSATQEIFVLNDVRAVDITNENYAIVERLAHWQAALNMAQDNFWFGVGFGNYEVAYESHRLLNWSEPLGHAHNYYLNVLGEAGIIGALSYLFAMIGIVGLTWQIRQHPDPVSRAMSVGLLGTWAYLLSHSLTDNLFVNNIFLHFGVMLGILAILHREIRQQMQVSIE